MIVVETGSGDNASANSYCDIDTLKAYASSRGTDLSSLTNEQLEPLLIQAMDYIESKRSEYQGNKSNQSQPLQWPRTPVFIDDVAIDDDVIPNELINAQCSLAISAQSTSLTVDVLPNQQGAVIKERVEGAVEVQYADASAYNAHITQPVFTQAESYLEPLYKSALSGSGTGFNCFLVRS